VFLTEVNNNFNFFVIKSYNDAIKLPIC